MESPLPVEHVPRRDAPAQTAPVSALWALEPEGHRAAEDGHVLQPLHPLPAHGAFREPALLVRLPRMDLEAGGAALHPGAAEPPPADAGDLRAPGPPLHHALPNPRRPDLRAGSGSPPRDGPAAAAPPGPRS